MLIPRRILIVAAAVLAPFFLAEFYHPFIWYRNFQKLKRYEALKILGSPDDSLLVKNRESWQRRAIIGDWALEVYYDDLYNTELKSSSPENEWIVLGSRVVYFVGGFKMQFATISYGSCIDGSWCQTESCHIAIGNFCVH